MIARCISAVNATRYIGTGTQTTRVVRCDLPRAEHRFAARPEAGERTGGDHGRGVGEVGDNFGVGRLRLI